MSENSESVKPTILDQVETPKKSSKALGFVVILGILVLSGVGFYYVADINMLHKPLNDSELPISNVDVANDAKIPADQTSNNLVFYETGELWERSEGILKQLTDTGKSINSYSTSEDASLVAYITGDVETNENGYALVTPKEVYLLDKRTGKAIKIHSLEPKKFAENSEYQRTLKAVDFSPSGKILTITASNALWTYDVASQKLTEVFFNEEENLDKGIVYSYFNPIFSKDESKIILSVGYYEGSSQIYVDLETKETRNLEFSAYVQGKRIVEHLEGSNWLLLEWSSSIDGQPSTKISSINLDTNEETTLKSIEDVSSTSIIKTKDLYILSGLTYWEKTNAEGTIFSGNDPRLMSWNVQTGELKTLYEAPQNSPDGKKSSSMSVIKPVSAYTNDFYVSVTDNIYGVGGRNEYRIQKYNSTKQRFETAEFNAALFVYR